MRHKARRRRNQLYDQQWLEQCERGYIECTLAGVVFNCEKRFAILDYTMVNVEIDGWSREGFFTRLDSTGRPKDTYLTMLSWCETQKAPMDWPTLARGMTWHLHVRLFPRKRPSQAVA